ncbi:sensor histidine kinase [Nocardia transvalensis]|uniref:sensor histidine kinase n=1 Tax=Nocardia transvalensis TaxID=37333 RepID=UPI0018943363|nr:sensor histidine kinase [Nocardia transvalensis]MBF6331450.1 sensor histidine kinase [Nocardia transvalensis]
MDQLPQLAVRALHRWYLAIWVLFGLIPPMIAVLDRSSTTKFVTVTSMAALAAAYVTVVRRPRLLRPSAFLGLLVVLLGVMSYVLEGGAAFFIVSLPMFWIHTSSPGRAAAWTGIGAVASLAGAVIRRDFFTGNVAFTLLGCAGGILIGLWMYRVVRHSDERAGRLRAELEQAQARLAEAHQRQGATEERERIAREIHDTLAQGFASIVVLSQAARAALDTAPERAAEQLLSIERTARDNLAEARILVGADPHGRVASTTLADLLRRTVDRFREDTGLTVTADLPDLDCDQPTRVALLRCTQESLANVRKHAAAGTVGVVLTRYSHRIELEITDDGRGFTPAEARGFGLHGMRKRLAELGGALTVTSSPGDGTRVLATIPANGQL